MSPPHLERCFNRRRSTTVTANRQVRSPLSYPVRKLPRKEQRKVGWFNLLTTRVKHLRRCQRGIWLAPSVLATAGRGVARLGRFLQRYGLLFKEGLDFGNARAAVGARAELPAHGIHARTPVSEHRVQYRGPAYLEARAHRWPAAIARIGWHAKQDAGAFSGTHSLFLEKASQPVARRQLGVRAYECAGFEALAAERRYPITLC